MSFAWKLARLHRAVLELERERDPAKIAFWKRLIALLKAPKERHND